MSDKKPLVSVIIPAYNQGVLLKRAIASALDQTYPFVEVVVVNDGSTDPATHATALSFGERIVYIQQENGGVATALNTGMRASRGEMIAWLGSDDLWLPRKLAVEVAALQAHPDAGLVFSNYYLIDENDQRFAEVKLRAGEWRPLPELLFGINLAAIAVLFTRARLDEIGLLDSDLRGSEDWHWYLRLAARGYAFYGVNESLSCYRKHQGNMTGKPDVIVPTWFQMLQKFYDLPDLPAEVRRWRNKAFFERHTGAAAVYYGARQQEKARLHLRQAARYSVSALLTIRFFQLLVYSRTQRPTAADVQEATSFVAQVLTEQGELATQLQRKFKSRSHMALAFYAAGTTHRLRALLVALVADPLVIKDGDLWATGRRILARPAQRATNKARQLLAKGATKWA